jgi:alanine-glyoxylate transaminase/serine-glyoxylate transaminase/serine-pyruvate transaminase
MARPTIGHLDPVFVQFMDDLKALLQQTFLTSSKLVLPISGPGTAGMESAFVNLVEPGDTVVVGRNGVFGERMRENVVRTGATPVVVDAPWGEPIEPEAVAEALDQHPEASIVAFVHAETSTGALSDAEGIAKVAHEHGCLVIADTVTSLGGVPVRMDDWQLDAVYSGSQKCLSCTPGLSPAAFSERAVERISRRTHPIQSWFLDTNLVMGYWGSSSRRSYHHTAPINALYGLHEALVILHEEGLEAAWARHLSNHLALVAGLEAMGLEMAVRPDARVPQLNSVRVPDGVDAEAIRRHLLTEHSLEIGAGLGDLAGQVWRIGLMGASSTPHHVIHCLTALEQALVDEGASIDRGAAVQAARTVLNE